MREEETWRDYFRLYTVTARLMRRERRPFCEALLARFSMEVGRQLGEMEETQHSVREVQSQRCESGCNQHTVTMCNQYTVTVALGAGGAEPTL